MKHIKKLFGSDFDLLATEMLEKSTECIRVTDEQGIILYANEAYCRLVGLSRKEVIGVFYFEIYHARTHNYENMRLEYTQRFQNRSIYPIFEREMVLRNGKTVFYELSNSFLNLYNGKQGLLSVFRDISKRKLMELRVHYDHLKELDSKKDEFLSIASHELRTPLTVIKGYISMMLEGDLGPVPPMIREALDQVYTSSHELVRLVGDMLDLSKFQSEKSDFIYEIVKIRPFLLGILDSKQTEYVKKKIKIIDAIAFDNEAYVNIPKEPVKRVVENLLENSIKFTPAGSITLSARLERKKIIFSVADTGVGISAEDRLRVFDTFTTAEKALKRATR
jgi:PAS domain S-box-containing protein